jgi:hypothetical protein
VAAQADSQPVGGNYPTDLWWGGEVFSDTHRVTLPADAPPGPYHVWTGLYAVETGQRLPVTDGARQPVTDAQIDLGVVAVR